MLTDPPIRRSVMLLCFGAAGLLVAAEWQTLRSQFVPIPWQTSRISHLEGMLEQSPLAAMVRQTRLVIRLEARKLELYEAD
ncbi:MAG: L,D-transpeptidase, partial [Cyanobacteria bacterium P01_H01_bin.58]